MSLLEHLPHLHFQGSTQGVILCIFSDGRAFLYPLNEEVMPYFLIPSLSFCLYYSLALTSSPAPPRVTNAQTKQKNAKQKNAAHGQSKDRTYQNAVLLSNSPPTKQSASRAAKNGAQGEKYFLYDANLELKHFVHKFQFQRDLGDKTVAERPRKIMLSPNKQMLLILGAYRGGVKSLLVYQIFETFPNPFHLIYSDYSFTFVDVCFSPDSRSLVCITARHPHYLFVLSLPLIECPHNKPHEATSSLFLSATSKKNVEHHVHARTTRTPFEPREAGPLQILGPCLSYSGQACPMTHVVSSYDPSENAYHYLTWSDAVNGEYCLWKALEDPSSGRKRYHMFPRLLNPEVVDLQWLNSADTPKTRIVGASFAEPPLERVLFVIKRDRYGKGPENGIGIQTCELNSQESGVWFQVTDSLDPEDVVCYKWTTPLLLGKDVSAGITVKRKGMFEMVGHRYTSAFQSTNANFVEKCCNVLQFGRFIRYWASSDGELRAFVVTPSVLSQHPEWSEMCRGGSAAAQNQDISLMRTLGRRIGYFIQDAQRENAATLESIYTARKGKSAVKKPPSASSGERIIGDCDVVDGIHLHRCWSCGVVLLKPLLCSRCKCAVYCGSQCQQHHWEHDHSKTCILK